MQICWACVWQKINKSLHLQYSYVLDVLICLPMCEISVEYTLFIYMPMKKAILYIFLLSLPFTMSAASECPVPIEGDAQIECFNNNEEEIIITLQGRDLNIKHAAGKTLEVFSVTGSRIATYRIHTSDKTVKLNRVCYIVKIGNIARKITVV